LVLKKYLACESVPTPALHELLGKTTHALEIRLEEQDVESPHNHERGPVGQAG